MQILTNFVYHHNEKLFTNLFLSWLDYNHFIIFSPFNPAIDLIKHFLISL